MLAVIFQKYAKAIAFFYILLITLFTSFEANADWVLDSTWNANKTVSRADYYAWSKTLTSGRWRVEMDVTDADCDFYVHGNSDWGLGDDKWDNEYGNRYKSENTSWADEYLEFDSTGQKWFFHAYAINSL
jgi:hypothetical protein